jgi:hypothetical protein
VRSSDWKCWYNPALGGSQKQILRPCQQSCRNAANALILHN